MKIRPILFNIILINKHFLPNFISILINININFLNILLRINKQGLLEQHHRTIKISLVLIHQGNIIQRESNCRIILIKQHSESFECLVVALESLLELSLLVKGVPEVQQGVQAREVGQLVQGGARRSRRDSIHAVVGAH